MHQTSQTLKNIILYCFRHNPAGPDSTVIYSKVVSLAKENSTDMYFAGGKCRKSGLIDYCEIFTFMGILLNCPKKWA